jgi:hypothetical protein
VLIDQSSFVLFIDGNPSSRYGHFHLTSLSYEEDIIVGYTFDISFIELELLKSEYENTSFNNIQIYWQEMSEGTANDLVYVSNGKLVYNDGEEKPVTSDMIDGTTKLTNITANTWYESTNADYRYAVDIAIEGVTSNSVVEVVFSLADATSGNYAPVCVTFDGGIRLFAKVNTTITIPTIIIFG